MQLSTPTGLIPISISTLSSTTALGLDIYLRASPNSQPVLFCAGSDLPELQQLARLTRQESKKLYIEASDHVRYQQYLRDNWGQILANVSVPISDRMAVMSEVIRDVLAEEFTTGDMDRIVSASQLMSRGTCKLVAEQVVLAEQLREVLHHDYATFTHSTNVSMYCVLLAHELGFSSHELEEIAVGGLLHDIGKLKIDERILTKPDRLDDFEFREIQKHPTSGYVELAVRDDLSLGQLMMTYQHHERIDGQGYPVGCIGEEIHPWARLCAIVDVYEALTSNRPYRCAMRTQTAMALLDKGDGTHFDSEMLRCWRQLINRRA